MDMDIHASVHSQGEFSICFSKEALEESADENKNCVFSPLSISVALSLAAGGAKGTTLDQICSCLNIKDVDQLHQVSSHLINVVLANESATGGPYLTFVNGVWVDKTITLKPNYRDILKNRYNAQASSVDFINKPNEVRMEVNKWAKTESKGKIEEFLSPDSVDEETRLILANALYFNGRWLEEFNSSATKEGTFTLLNGESVQVPMMTTRKNQLIKTVDECKILRLPYLQGRDNRSFSMYIILPNDINGLPEMERNLDLTFLEKHLPTRVTTVQVRSFQLPRFKISSSVNATQILKRMGLVVPFCDDAEFYEMVEFNGGVRVNISAVLHKSFVEVDEVGTEATAVTAVCHKSCAYKYPIEDFVADHPFMFVIKEDTTGVILFVGHVLNPLGS